MTKKTKKTNKTAEKKTRPFNLEGWVIRFLRVASFWKVLSFLTRDAKVVATTETETAEAKTDFLKSAVFTARAASFFKKDKKASDRGFRAFRWAAYLSDTGAAKNEDYLFKAVLKTAKERAKGKGKDAIAYRKALPLLEKAHYYRAVLKNVPISK